MSHSDIKILQLNSPILGGLIIDLNLSSNTEGRLALHEMFLFMSSVLKTMSDKDSNDAIHDITEAEHEDILKSLPSYKATDSLNNVELWDSGSFFPGRRIYRKLNRITIGTETEINCTKIAKKRGKLGPGVLWYFCGKHNLCLGFTILYGAESCKQVAETLMTRFSKPPKHVIYDNACNLEDWILNRYSAFFNDTRFYVDSFHFKCHTNCAPSYDSGLHHDILKGVNTSLVEQRNSKLRFLKPTAPYMKARTFMSKLKYVVNYINNASLK